MAKPEKTKIEWPGKRISKDELEKLPHVIAKPQAKYAWAAGVAMSRFLEELKNGRIIGRACKRCKRVLVPPRMFCERCFRPTDDWQYLPDTGIIETFSISYIDTNAQRIKEPILVGVVALDGAPPHCGFMHYFSEVSPNEIHIGMAVEAVWKPQRERTGSILDIKYFRPRRQKQSTSSQVNKSASSKRYDRSVKRRPS